MRTVWPAALAAVLAACGGSKESPPPPPPGTFTLSGTVTYDSVPPTVNLGLDYAHTVPKPVRGAVVEVVAGSALGSGTTSDAGAYSITWTGTPAVSLRVKAQTLAPPMRVQDNFNGNALYALDSGAVNASTTSTLDLNAPSGWTGSSYGAPRAAAPFAILDSMYSAAKAFLAVAPGTVFPELKANWSPNNSLGTFYDPSTGELTLLGQANVDTDEYDTHVVIHEWGHYFEDRLSRADSQGGSHSLGEQKDPRLAFSEGWGNALGAMVLYPDDLYADTMGASQTATGIRFHLETDTDYDSAPGWYSEMSVAHFLYDVFDSPASDDEGLSLGLGPIHGVLVGPQKATPAFTTLFSFVDALKTTQPAAATAIDARLSGRNVSIGATDAFGTGETVNAPGVGNLPVYNPITVNGGQVSVTLNAPYSYNDLQQTRFLRFTGNGAQVTITAGTTLVDVSLEVWSGGQRLRKVDTPGPPFEGVETTSLPTTAGATYLVVVTGYETAGGAYSVPVTVTSP
ncbi:MAG TPA: hypothetical protein VFR85_08010 [Anaeromyxobacteraceae bacterium]|nr:hypothetical protein [Anaeromyxobacteraceae bacterium]